MNKKTILSAIAALGFSLTAAADNERLILTYADGQRATVYLSYLDHFTYDYTDTDRTTGLGYLSMLAHMNSGAVNRISLEGLESVDFLADFRNPLGETYREVQREHGENATIVMLNCINNRNGNTYVITPERDDDYTAQRYGERGFFLIDTPLGYDSDFSVTGVESGQRYAATWLLQNDSENPNGQSCWAFTMPNEAVRIKAWATEETVYDGQPWLGTYAGFPLEVIDGYVYGMSGYAFAPASLTFKGNATYLFATNKPESLSAHGRYTYDADAEKFRYVPKPDDADLVAPSGQHEYAVTAARLHSPFNPDEANLDALAVHVRDLTVDKPENTRHFLAFPQDQYDAGVDYNCAYFNNYNGTTGRSTQSLLEARLGDPNVGDFSYAWYFVDNYGASFSEVVLNFEAHDDLPEGETIFEPGYARFELDGREMYFMHSADGVLSVGEYVAPVDPTPGLGEAATWEGPLTYYAAANGRYDGGALSQNATVTVMLDQNYNGSSNPGHAVLKATCGGRELIGAGGDYAYYPAEQKIVISHVLQGTDMSWTTDYLDVVINVAPDLQTLTIEGVDGYLYGSRTNTCIEVGANCVLKAQ